MRLYDTLHGRVEEFAPLEPSHVRMYNCGPTVYRRNHLGNYRAYATADLLRRTFEFLGWRVTQIMNITDVGHLAEDDAADARGGAGGVGCGDCQFGQRFHATGGSGHRGVESER